jgi:hypothetical protein
MRGVGRRDELANRRLGTRHEAQEMRDEGQGTRDELANRRLGRRDELANKRLEGNYYNIKSTSAYYLVISAFLLLQCKELDYFENHQN